jgi:hypothetical protein
MKSFRQLGWDLAHNRRAFAADLLGPIGMLPLKWSEWYQDCVEIYCRLDVRNKVVIDIGSDFGTTPLFFLEEMGAKCVIGFSLEPQYFFHSRYRHFRIPPEGMDKLPIGIDEMPLDVLKVDAEGLEWEFDPEDVEPYHDWMIALHHPIQNQELYEWIKVHGELVATKNTKEFAVYQKRK